MPKIYKYRLTSPATQLSLPQFAKVLSVQAQHECVCMWVSQEPDGRFPKMRTFETVPTGGNTPAGAYLGTVQLDGGDLVYHVFETTGV